MKQQNYELENQISQVTAQLTEEKVSDIREKLESEFKGYQNDRPEGVKIILCPTDHLLQGNNENYLTFG